MELLAIILIIAAIVAVEALIFSKYALKGIEYSASIDRNEVYEGEYIELTEVIKNSRLVGIPWIKTELSASRWLAFLRKDSAVQTSNSENIFIPGVFSLGPRKMCTRIRRIKCLKRGVFSFDDTVITATDVLGLIKITKNVSVKIKVTVLPVSADGEDAVLSFNEPIGEMVVRRFINDDPFMIAGSKEYTGREPINRIYWNYTAAKNNLMVFNNEYSTSRNILLIMNMQRRSIQPVSCLYIRDLEAYIKLSVKIAEEALSKCGTFAFTTNGGNKNGFATDVIKDTEHFESLLRQLALLEPVCDYDFRDYSERLNLAQFTDIIILTPYIDEVMENIASKCSERGKNIVFYTNDESYEQNDSIQFLPINRFSFRWNFEE